MLGSSLLSTRRHVSLRRVGRGRPSGGQTLFSVHSPCVYPQGIAVRMLYVHRSCLGRAWVVVLVVGWWLSLAYACGALLSILSN